MEGFQSFIGVDFWTALFTLLNFLAVLIVGKKFLWGPVMKMIQDRQQEIDDMYSEADTARVSAKAMEEEYKQKLSAAMETGERIVKDATARGQAKEEEILRQANAEASAMLVRLLGKEAEEQGCRRHRHGKEEGHQRRKGRDLRHGYGHCGEGGGS